MSNKLRSVLSYMNMKKISEKANISYDILRNFYYGKKENLSPIEEEKVITTIKELTKL